MIQDEDEHRRRQQQTAERATRRYSRQSALALCVPLMAWGGVLGGSMALTPATSLPWLGAVGLLTLVVMVVAGGRFYRSAANSLRNGSATMDTLVALETGAV